MANITRFSPFRAIGRFSPLEDMERMLDSVWQRPLLGGNLPDGSDLRIDVSEDANAYTVRADIPGVSNKDDIQVSIDGNQVSISAEIKQSATNQASNQLCCERYYGQQFRSFTLGCAIDEGDANAKYENGVLELTLPKKAGTGTRQLKVQ